MNQYINSSVNSEKGDYLNAQYYFENSEYIECLLILQKILSRNKKGDQLDRKFFPT